MKNLEYVLSKRLYFEIFFEEGKQIDFESIFGNDNPVHIEIGSGRGEFIAQKAILEPQINFVGIELKEKRFPSILAKLEPTTHNNVRLMRLFVDENIASYITPHSIETVYIIHPDPWPKRKHHPRRIFQHTFINAVNMMLTDNGLFRISTDHQEYAMWIQKKFKERDDFESIYENGVSRIAPDGHVKTHFEDMKKREGFEPYYFVYKKVKDYDRQKQTD